MAGYLGAPVTTTLCAAGFCSQYALHLGVSGGLGSGLAVDTLAESDAMVIGASLNEWTTHFGKILASDLTANSLILLKWYYFLEAKLLSLFKGLKISMMPSPTGC